MRNDLGKKKGEKQDVQDDTYKFERCISFRLCQIRTHVLREHVETIVHVRHTEKETKRDHVLKLFAKIQREKMGRL